MKDQIAAHPGESGDKYGDINAEILFRINPVEHFSEKFGHYFTPSLLCR